LSVVVQWILTNPNSSVVKLKKSVQISEFVWISKHIDYIQNTLIEVGGVIIIILTGSIPTASSDGSRTVAVVRSTCPVDPY